MSSALQHTGGGISWADEVGGCGGRALWLLFGAAGVHCGIRGWRRRIRRNLGEINAVKRISRRLDVVMPAKFATAVLPRSGVSLVPSPCWRRSESSRLPLLLRAPAGVVRPPVGCSITGKALTRFASPSLIGQRQRVPCRASVPLTRSTGCAPIGAAAKSLEANGNGLWRATAEVNSAKMYAGPAPVRCWSPRRRGRMAEELHSAASSGHAVVRR